MFYSPVWEYGEFKLVIRPDTPNYHAYWHGGGRAQRRSTGTSDLAEAQRFLIAIAEKHAAPAPERSASETPILDVVSDYIERLRTDGKYWRSSVSALKHLLEFTRLTGCRFVDQFGFDAQRQYVEWRMVRLKAQGHRASNATLNKELGVIRAALRSAHKRGRLESAPHVELLPTPPPRQRFLRPHEVKRLLAACETPHLRLYVLLALHTLQRPGAIFGLKVEQVDLGWGRIDFLPPGSSQNVKRRPVVPITPTLYPHLERAVADSITGHVLEYDGKPLKSVKRSFAKACERAGLDDVMLYTLRHTGATLMAASGVPLRQIAGWLGHTETRTTELYAKHHPDYLSEAAVSIERLFGGETAKFHPRSSLAGNEDEHLVYGDPPTHKLARSLKAAESGAGQTSCGHAKLDRHLEHRN